MLVTPFFLEPLDSRGGVVAEKNGSHKKHGLGDKVAVSVYLYLHPYLGEMIQFDDHIFFQMG